MERIHKPRTRRAATPLWDIRPHRGQLTRHGRGRGGEKDIWNAPQNRSMHDCGQHHSSSSMVVACATNSKERSCCPAVSCVACAHYRIQSRAAFEEVRAKRIDSRLRSSPHWTSGSSCRHSPGPRIAHGRRSQPPPYSRVVVSLRDYGVGS